MQQLESPISPENRIHSFLKQLKSSTEGDHLALESNILLAALISPQITTLQYYTYLVLMRAVATRYEDVAFERIPELLPEWKFRKFSTVISADLVHIGYDTYKPMQPKDYVLPFEIKTPAHVLAFMYVMEGSRLGGKIIFKNVNRQLGYAENSGASYLADTGFNTGVLWKEFLTRFSTYVVTHDIEQTTIDSVTAVFRSIYNFFESNRDLYEI